MCATFRSCVRMDGGVGMVFPGGALPACRVGELAVYTRSFHFIISLIPHPPATRFSPLCWSQWSHWEDRAPSHEVGDSRGDLFSLHPNKLFLFCRFWGRSYKGSECKPMSHPALQTAQRTVLQCQCYVHQ